MEKTKWRMVRKIRKALAKIGIDVPTFAKIMGNIHLKTSRNIHNPKLEAFPREIIREVLTRFSDFDSVTIKIIVDVMMKI